MRTRASWPDVITDYRAYLAAAGRPATTIKLRVYQLRRFAEDHRGSPWKPTTQTIVNWLAGQHWSADTKKSYRSALVGFYRWARTMGHTTSDPTADLPAITALVHRPRPCPEIIYREALARHAADPDVYLMLLLAGGQGLRRGEIAQIHSNDLFPDLIGHSLRVHGKGSKERIVPLEPAIAALLLDRGPGWAFPSPAPGRAGEHLTAGNVGVVIRRALPTGWSAHTLRHRFATVAYARTRDLLAVQELMGHSRPETTRGYILMPAEPLRAAVAAAA
ncbi:MAG: tyrosine-type recombinase/integrase [Thermomicrobiales bacterium]